MEGDDFVLDEYIPESFEFVDNLGRHHCNSLFPFRALCQVF